MQLHPPSKVSAGVRSASAAAAAFRRLSSPTRARRPRGKGSRRQWICELFSVVKDWDWGHVVPCLDQVSVQGAKQGAWIEKHGVQQWPTIDMLLTSADHYSLMASPRGPACAISAGCSASSKAKAPAAPAAPAPCNRLSGLLLTEIFCKRP
jgi:hypothetical protein